MTNAYGFSDVGQWWWNGLRAIEEYDWSTPVDAQTTAHIPPSTSHSTLQSSFIMSSLPEQAKEQSEEFKKPVSPLPQAKPVTTLNTDKNLPAVVLSEQDIQDELRVNVSFGSEELSTESDRVDNRLPTLPLATETLPAEVVNDRLGEQQDGTPLELPSNESVSSPVIIYADKPAINNVTVSCRTIRYIAVTQEERDDIDDFHGVDGEQASFNPSNLVIEQWNPLGAQLPPPPPPPPFMVTIPREPMSTDGINTVCVIGEPFTLSAAGMPPSHTFEGSSRNIPSNASSHTLSNAPSHTLSNGPSYTVSNPANVERIIHLTSNNAITTPAVAEFLADEAESDAEEEREDLPLAHGVQGVTVDSPKSPRSYSDLLYEFPLRGATDGSSEPDRLATWKDDGPSDLSAPREHSLGSEHGSQPAIEEEDVEQTPVLEMTAIKRKRIARVLFPQEPSSPKSPQAEISFGAVVIRSSSPVQPSRSRISPQPTPSLYDHASSTEEEQPTKKKTKTVATRKVPAKKRNWLGFGLPNIMKQNINGMGDRTIEQIVEELANERQENSQGSADDAMVDDETSGKELMELAAKSSTETDPQKKVSTKPQSASLSFPDPEAIQGVTNGTEKTINEIFDDFVKETQDKRSIWDDFPTLNPTDFTHHFVDRVEEKRATYSPEAYSAWVEKCRASGERARVERLRVEAENNAKAALEQEEENIERNEDGEEDQEDQEDETTEQQVPQAAALAKEKPKFKSSIAPRRSSRVSATPGPSAAHPTVAPAPVSESDAFSGSDTGSKPEYFDAKPTTRSEMKAFRMQQMNAAIAAEMTPATGKGAKATIPTNLNAKSSKAASTSKAAPAPAKEPKIISKPTTTRASRTKFKGDKKALGVVPADQVDTDESESEDEFITAPAMAKKAYFKDTESVTGSEDENATTRAPVKKPKVTPKTTNKHAATTKGKGKLSAKETEAVAPNSEDESDSENEDAALPSVEKKYKDVVKKTKKLLSNTKGESKGKKEVIVIESDSDSDDADEDSDDETKEYIPRLRRKQPSYQPSYVSVDLNSRQKNPFYESWLRRQAHGEAEAREKAKQARDARKRRLSLGADADAVEEEEREEEPLRKKHKTRGASEKEVKGKDAGKKGKGVEEKKSAKGIGNGDAKRKGNGQFAKGDKSKRKRKTF